MVTGLLLNIHPFHFMFANAMSFFWIIINILKSLLFFKQTLNIQTLLLHTQRGSTGVLGFTWSPLASETRGCRMHRAEKAQMSTWSLASLWRAPLKMFYVLKWLHLASQLLHFRKRQYQCAMVSVLAKLFICHSLVIILDLQKKLWYKKSKDSEAPGQQQSSCPAQAGYGECCRQQRGWTLWLWAVDYNGVPALLPCLETPWTGAWRSGVLS